MGTYDLEEEAAQKELAPEEAALLATKFKSTQYTKQLKSFKRNAGISAEAKPWYHLIQERLGAPPAAPDREHLPPRTAEGSHYRGIFDATYPGCAAVIPHYWMPRWSGQDAEPSGRLVAVPAQAHA